jgi:DNA-binding NtrC family response regulator
MILASAQSEILAERVAHIASSSVPVMIEGETGTGKSAWSRRLHDSGERASAPFVVVDCTRARGDLLQSELFGHTRGAFTGAHASRRGAIEAADRGTLFLDEVAELDLEAQAMLLRVVETGLVRRVGSTEERRVDVRIISATWRDLDLMMARGRFRADLFYRLAVVRLRVAPLRDRPVDMLAIAMERAGSIPDGAAPLLAGYPWPGNVRELLNVIDGLQALEEWTLEGIRQRLGEEHHSPGLDLLDTIKRETQRLGEVRASQLRAITGLSRSALQRRLQALVEEGLVAQEGSARATTYRAVEGS